MKKIKNLFFPQKGKDKSSVRIYLVLLYTAVVAGIILTFVYFANYVSNANILSTRDVQRELSLSLLDSSITSETVGVFTNAKISGTDSVIKDYANGYEYKYDLLYTTIPALASKAETDREAQNIMDVRDILEKRLEEYSEARAEIFSTSSAITEALLMIAVVGIPFFIFFRSVVYRIFLYIIYGKNEVNNEII